MILFEIVDSVLTLTFRVVTDAGVLCCDGIVARYFRSGVPLGFSAVTVGVTVGGFTFCTCRWSGGRSSVDFGEVEEQGCTIGSIQFFVIT